MASGSQRDDDIKLTVEEEPKVEKLKKREESKSAVLPVMKCVVAGFICLVVLGCSVFSKVFVIAVAEHLDEGNTGNRVENARVFIMLTLILMVPQAWSFTTSLWRGLRYKNRPWPTKKGIVAAIIGSFLEVIGLCIFTMITLSRNVPIRGNESVAVMNCVSIVPILWQWWKKRHGDSSFRMKVLLLVCGLVQVAAFPVIIWYRGKDNYTYSVLSLILVSLAWSPKMRKWQIKARREPGEQAESDLEDSTHPGELLHRRTARTKATTIAEGVKLLITPFVGFAVSIIFGFFKPGDLHEGFVKMGKSHDHIFNYFLSNIFLSFIGYIFAKAACSMSIQKIGFALPLTFATPISFILLSIWKVCQGLDTHIKCTGDYEMHIPLVVFVWLAQLLSTIYYVWQSQDFIMAKESQLFWVSSYNGVLLEQNLLLNRKNQLTDDYIVDQNKLARDSVIFICTTMYHEADYEMEQLLRSLHQVDCARNISKRRIESHIWFDGAVKREVLNNYVLQLISLVSKTMGVKVSAVMKLETPYGMELRWRLPGGMNFHIHLKDNIKVKNKKRWSQVMYMSYVLDFKRKQLQAREEDTYILTTDADIKFNADSVEALLDLMMRDPKVGAVCGRTHPLGTGPMVWYQIFDYAIGHWFQKVANHVIGSVLCCPGCFSVYRAKALRDVLPLYASNAGSAVDFLTKDMGEDRWLCTLMVQAGWRLEYCAAAENETFCPEEFYEFYKQRRRWIPSTLANLGLLISEWQITVRNNNMISFIFILYQFANVFSTLISPATVILIISGGLEYGWGIDAVTSLILLVLVAFLYGLICLYTSQDFQLKTAKVLTLIFALVMGVVIVGLAVQIAGNPEGEQPTTIPPTYPTYRPPTPNKTSILEKLVPTKMYRNEGNFILRASNESTTAPSTKKSTVSSSSDDLLGGFAVSSWYLFGLIGVYIITALCHPTEAYCLMHGFWYFLSLPSGYLFLIIYSVCNLTDRSWGTRENTVKTNSGESVLQLMSDKLIWLCRGCKDPEGSSQPQVTPINAASESSTSETSESDVTLSEGDKQDESGEDYDSANKTRTTESSSHDSEVSTSSSSSTAMPKSVLKKGGKSKALSPAGFLDGNKKTFRFPGERTVRFPAKLPTAKSHTPVAEWLQGRMKEYIPNFEQNGYDDTSFISLMNEKDLEDIGIGIRGHRKKLYTEIQQLPDWELDNNVPESVEKWLADLGLHEYWLNFKNNSITTPRDLEGLKVMNSTDLQKNLHGELQVHKKGHLAKLVQAMKKLQYPSAIERKIREARLTMNSLPLNHLNNDNDKEEFEFWSLLREKKLLPEAKAFGQQSELSIKLGELRDSALLFLTVANLLWIILISTLTRKANLQVVGVNPLGLSFLIVYGFIIVIQFFTMLWHRVDTVLHLLARAPFRAGDSSVKVWSFDDHHLPPPPSEEDLLKVRTRRSKKESRRSREALCQSGDESPLLKNGGAFGVPRYHATSSRDSPLPI